MITEEENSPSAVGREESARAVMGLFQDQPSRRLSFNAIATKLKGRHTDLSGAVENLVEEGLLWPAGGGRYALASEMGILRGRIVMRSDGSGFVKADGSRVEIDRRNSGGALDGDTVFVKKLDQLQGENRFRGKVLEVLKRYRDGVSGVARKRGGKWVIDPVDPALPRNIPLKTGPESGIGQGRLVFAYLDYSGRRLSARLKSDLGTPDSPSALLDSVALDHGLTDGFPDVVSAEAREAADLPLAAEGRTDFRKLFTITIDPVDARDFDDAISYREEDGSRILYVHIADVAEYVDHGSPADLEARRRGTSVYLPDRVVPMLPEVLSNGACSLRPGEEKLTRTVKITFSVTGAREEFEIIPSIIRSDRRMNYSEALDHLEGRGGEDELKQLFEALGRLTRDLNTQRERRGALEISSSDIKTLFDEKGMPCGFRQVPSDRAHRMIENFMVEANRAVADHCTWSGLPVLYRVHDDPSRRSEDRLLRQLEELEVEVPRGRIHNPSVIRDLLEDLEGSPKKDLVVELVLRSMRKAVYKPMNTGHYGLALDSYMHFTSPIRRYPDLLVHQALKMQEQGVLPAFPEDLVQLSEEVSASEDNAESAERDARELMALMYLSGNIGMEVSGVVTGVERFGIFVRLKGIPVEGLAHRKEIGKSGVRFHGKSGPYRKGSVLKVRVLSSDVMERKLSLRPVEDDNGKN
ncbi:MAG: VacB/RNase II family 3'-5' exoribonuclease [Candidatus Aegiribacteria sp.]|nr:VacB/RNase II family 3'-5' exoribonuclease [Candidatus Aegiribacteria sp.]MBD3295565.1 VacB/RNase II family 3'-5' exoribonuclease [Candidatus Fermentibacteria bacterium]